MKYIKLTSAEANKIGFYRINDWLAINALAGKLKSGGYALPEAVINDLLKLKKSTKINGIDLNEKSRVSLDKTKFKEDKLK